MRPLITPGLLLLALLHASGCASEDAAAPASAGSGGLAATEPSMKQPFFFREARLPQGFPPPGPVGVVMIKQYPAARAAMVQAHDVKGGGQNQMFGPLFNHIKKNEIAMTSPVEMSLRNAQEDPTPQTMAFIYSNPQTGSAGADGIVQVKDLEPLTVVSVAVRGG